MPESSFDVINFEMERDKSIVLGELLNAKSDDFNKVSLSTSVLRLNLSFSHRNICDFMSSSGHPLMSVPKLSKNSPKRKITSFLIFFLDKYESKQHYVDLHVLLIIC